MRRDSAVGVPDSAVRAPGRMGWAAAGRMDCSGPPNVTWPQRSGPRGKRTRPCGSNFPTASRPWYGPHLPHPQAHATSAPWPHATSAPWPHAISAPCQSPEVAQSNCATTERHGTESPTGLLRNRAALNSDGNARVTASQRPLQKPPPPKPHAKPPTTNHGHTPPQGATAPNLRKESPHRITTGNRAPNHTVKPHGGSPRRRPTAEGHESSPATLTRSPRHPHPQPPPAHERRPRFAPGEGGKRGLRIKLLRLGRRCTPTGPGAPHPRGERRPCAARWCTDQGAERGAAGSLSTEVLQVLRWSEDRAWSGDDPLR